MVPNMSGAARAHNGSRALNRPPTPSKIAAVPFNPMLPFELTARDGRIWIGPQSRQRGPPVPFDMKGTPLPLPPLRVGASARLINATAVAAGISWSGFQLKDTNCVEVRVQ